jgi:hypothetical protein
MNEYPDDIFTEPEDVDPDTLANLGPLRALAGIWEGTKGFDLNPGPGPQRQRFIERIELQPIDPQTNGPQILYGLAYVTRIVKPGELESFHHQVGHWLWEASTGTVLQSLSIPRAQVALAAGNATADSKTFELVAARGSNSFGICSGPFLEYAFRTDSYRITVTVHPDGRWSYEQETVLTIRGRAAPFLHTDRNTLTRIADPTPNPLMRLAQPAAAPAPPSGRQSNRA